MAAGAQQVGQAAHQLGVVLGGHKAALLVAGWIDDDQVVGAAARDLAPAAEDVVRQKAGARQPVELVVVLAGGQGALGHVHVQHLARAGVQRSDGEGAGVGEQVQHLQAVAVFGVLRHMRAHPAAAGGHVQEQAVVLAAQHMGAVLQAGLGDDVRLGHAAAHQARLGLGAGLAHLVDPVQRLALADLCPAREQGAVQGLQRGLVQRLEAGQHQHGGEGVQHQVLAAGVAPAAAVEQAAGIGRDFELGDGVEQGLHGIHGKNTRARVCGHSPGPGGGRSTAPAGRGRRCACHTGFTHLSRACHGSCRPSRHPAFARMRP